MNRNETIGPEQANIILAQCNRISFDDILPDQVYDVLSVEAQTVGTSVEFMLPSLLAGLGLTLHQSTTESFKKSRAGLGSYTGLINQPSTGKSIASNLVKHSLSMVESYMGVDQNKSALTNTPTVEGLMHHLSKIPCMCALYDESTTWLGSLGRYSNGAAPYERSIYLTLFGAVESMERDLKNSRSKIVEPRFHISFNGHPIQVINLLRNERFSFDDGLFQRFLFCAPKPAKIYSDDIHSTPDSIVTLHCIFYFIYVLHFEKRRNYTFSTEAKVIIDAHFNINKDRVDVLNVFDSFAGAMAGKSHTQVIRISTMLQAITVACSLLHGQIGANKSELTTDFADNVQRIIGRISPQVFVITADIATRAVKMIEYFNKHKLILSGYLIDPLGSFEEAYSKITGTRPRQSTLSNQMATISMKTIRFMKKAFTIPFTRINASRLSQNNLSVAEAKEVFKNLEEMGLGKQEMVNSNNHHQVNYFVRVSVEQIKKQPELGQYLVDIGLNLPIVMRCLEETEYNESINPDSSVGRKRSSRSFQNENISPESKRFKLASTQVTKVRKDNGVPYVLSQPITFDENARHALQPITISDNSDPTVPTDVIQSSPAVPAYGMVNRIFETQENQDTLDEGVHDDSNQSIIQQAQTVHDDDSTSESSLSNSSNNNSNTNQAVDEAFESQQSSNNTQSSQLSSSGSTSSLTKSSNNNQSSQLSSSGSTSSLTKSKSSRSTYVREIDPKTGKPKRGRMSNAERAAKEHHDQLQNQLNPTTSSNIVDSIRTRLRSSSRDRNADSNEIAPVNNIYVVERKKNSNRTKSFAPRTANNSSIPDSSNNNNNFLI